MENSYDILVHLIELKKKKKEPNNLERDKFASAWAALVKEEGFSKRAEGFLYNGYTYCGARPFRDYMREKENFVEALKELYSGSLYRDNCASTTSILLHLLSLELNNVEDIGIIVSLMQHLPGALKNKEGNLYGQADRALKKYFLEELNSEIKFPDLTELLDNGLASLSLKEFVDAIDTVVNKMDFSKYSHRCQINIQKVTRWLHPKIEKNVLCASKEKTLLVQQSGDEKLKKQFKTIEITDRIEGPGSKDTVAEKVEESVTEYAEKQMSEVQSDFQKRLAATEHAILQFKQKAEEDKQKIFLLEDTIKNERNELSAKSNRLATLLTENKELRLKIASLEKQEVKFKEEIEQRSEMIDMLRRDRAKQSDENMKRLASKLRTYYTDYMDAENLEMSIELGENMRDQLGEVLSIISSSGISCK